VLVLTRKLNEKIIIGDDVRITVVGIRGNHVRLGIEASPDVSILRDELIRHREPSSTESQPISASSGVAVGIEH
jgi:carbon storage regulator